MTEQYLGIDNTSRALGTLGQNYPRFWSEYKTAGIGIFLFSLFCVFSMPDSNKIQYCLSGPNHVLKTRQTVCPFYKLTCACVKMLQ